MTSTDEELIANLPAERLPMLPVSPGIPVEEAAAPPESPALQSWRRFRRNRMAVICLGILAIAAVGATFAPLYLHYDPVASDAANSPLDAGPSAAHWLGTDGLGRDVLTRVIYGMRAPLFVAIGGGILCTLIGAFTGVLAGYKQGWIDTILSRITEIIFVLPGLLLFIAFMAYFGPYIDQQFGYVGRIVFIMLFVATDSWPVIMRVARSETLRLKNEPFIEAAQLCGASTFRTLRRHLLPNMSGILLVQGSFFISGFIYTTAVLAIVGLGMPTAPDIGKMILDGQEHDMLNAYELWGPCVAIATLGGAATFLADGLRDAFDTRRS